MALDLADYETKAKESVMAFWGNREAARAKQIESGKTDNGERAGVTAGKNMDGFVAMVIDVVKANGLSESTIYRKKALLTLPGYFRPTKLWDLLVIHDGQLIAALEFKSQVGPSFGKNFNNRTEEAIGTAHDLWTAQRESAFGNSQPFLGWLMLVEDCAKTQQPVRDASPHFPIFPEFQGASYIRRYDLLCQRLVKERLYNAASVIASPRSGITNGAYSSTSEITSLKMFVTELAGHIASAAARL